MARPGPWGRVERGHPAVPGRGQLAVHPRGSLSHSAPPPLAVPPADGAAEPGSRRDLGLPHPPQLDFAARRRHTPAGAGLLFARLLALAGLALTFSVEFFYLRDGFGLRMNTVFKFYFQGWVMLACASAYALWWLARAGMRAPSCGSCCTAGSAVLILAGLVFPLAGVFSRTNGFASAPDLDGTSDLRRENPDDWAAIDWLDANGLEEGRPPVLLEAPGKSYTYEGRITAFTGFPAVLGWAIHEMQWRGSYTEQGRREPVIAEIYTTARRFIRPEPAARAEGELRDPGYARAEIHPRAVQPAGARVQSGIGGEQIRGGARAGLSARRGDYLRSPVGGPCGHLLQLIPFVLLVVAKQPDKGLFIE